jgi:hypothetical protein
VSWGFNCKVKVPVDSCAKRRPPVWQGKYRYRYLRLELPPGAARDPSKLCVPVRLKVGTLRYERAFKRYFGLEVVRTAVF